MERDGSMDTRRPIAARETERLTTESGAMLDKSWAARRQGTPAAQPVRWRRAPAALQNLPQRAQRVPTPRSPLGQPPRGHDAPRSIYQPRIGSIGDFNGLIGKKGSPVVVDGDRAALFLPFFFFLSSNFYYSTSIYIYIHIRIYICIHI